MLKVSIHSVKKKIGQILHVKQILPIPWELLNWFSCLGSLGKCLNFLCGKKFVKWYRVGRHRGWDIGVLIQVNSGTAILFRHNNFVLAARRIGANLLDYSVHGKADTVRGSRNVISATENEEPQTVGK